MESGEILKFGGGDEPEIVAGVDFVGEIGVRDADGGVDGVAGAGDGNKERLAGEEGKSGVGVGDVAEARNFEAADPEKVSNGSQVEEIGGGGSVEDVGLAWVGSLVGGAGVAVGVGTLGGGVMEGENDDDDEEEESRGAMADWGFHGEFWV